jgi:DNA-binding response OmpR family regulator
MARILIVDDDASLAVVVAHCVRTAGHTPLPAPTGHAALCAARAHPDVILLDLGLPDIAGDEVLRRLKRDPATAPIPVVIVSGEPNAAARVPRGGAAGAVAILQKPVGGAALCAVVDFVLAERTAAPAAAPGAPGPGRGWLPSQQRDLISRLLSRGSDPLVHQVYRRLVADRTGRPAPSAPPAPSWPELACAGRQEGLLSDEERALLAACPPPGVAASGPAEAPRAG